MDQEAPAEQAFAARCLMRAAKWATLATTRIESDGTTQPFASLVTPAVAPDGGVLMLLSSLAEHTRHLTAAPRCALIFVGKPENANWQTAPRVTVIGQAHALVDRRAKDFWIGRHPYARLYAEFTDFSLFRLIPDEALYVGGFAQAARVPGAALLPDGAALVSVVAAADALIADCNQAHQEALARVAHAAGASGTWRLLGIDTDGIDLAQDDVALRVPFEAPVADGAAALEAVLRLAETAQRQLW